MKACKDKCCHNNDEKAELLPGGYSSKEIGNSLSTSLQILFGEKIVKGFILVGQKVGFQTEFPIFGFSR